MLWPAISLLPPQTQYFSRQNSLLFVGKRQDALFPLQFSKDHVQVGMYVGTTLTMSRIKRFRIQIPLFFKNIKRIFPAFFVPALYMRDIVSVVGTRI